jgi:hypothetical protein
MLSYCGPPLLLPAYLAAYHNYLPEAMTYSNSVVLLGTQRNKLEQINFSMKCTSFPKCSSAYLIGLDVNLLNVKTCRHKTNQAADIMLQRGNILPSVYLNATPKMLQIKYVNIK